MYESAAYLLERTVEHNPRRGFSFAVDRVKDLPAALAGAAIDANVSPASGRARAAG